MNYLTWLMGGSLFFFLLERVYPERPRQRWLRPQLSNDLFYLLFNGHVYSILTGVAVTWCAFETRALLGALGWLPQSGWLDTAPLILAAAVYLIISDFLQWMIHVMLHKVPCLWEFHKLHHSVVNMDWAGNFRFHWVELVVYRSALYVPLLFLGGPLEALFPVWIFATYWGHFNHSNLRIDIGPLGYVMNSPRMHLWHHDASSEGGAAKNFGIVFSLWDFLFRTAYWPRDRAPRALGFPGLEQLPRALPSQLIWPLGAKRPRATPD